MSCCDSVPNCNLTIYKNATFIKEFIYEDADHAPINLTGCTAKSQMREAFDSPSAFITIDTEGTGMQGDIALGGSAGTIIMTINDVTTEGLTQTNGVWDFLLIFADGTIKRLVEGSVIIKAGVTVP